MAREHRAPCSAPAELRRGRAGDARTSRPRGRPAASAAAAAAASAAASAAAAAAAVPAHEAPSKQLLGEWRKFRPPRLDWPRPLLRGHRAARRRGAARRRRAARRPPEAAPWRRAQPSPRAPRAERERRAAERGLGAPRARRHRREDAPPPRGVLRPLMEAAVEGAAAIVRLLTGAGADAAAASARGHTALALAAKGGHAKAVEALLAALADVKAEPVAGSLDAAARAGHVGALRMMPIAVMAARNCAAVLQAAASARPRRWRCRGRLALWRWLALWRRGRCVATAVVILYPYYFRVYILIIINTASSK